MAALDFPNSPTVGQLYPSPPVAGVPVYRWDGTVWTMQAGTGLDYIPSGTVMLFYQAAAPVGWTQVTTHNDKGLRVVSGVGGGSGGTNSFSTVMAQTVVGNHTQSLAETPSNINTSGGNTITVYMNGTSVYNADGFSGAYTSWQNPTASGQYDFVQPNPGPNVITSWTNGNTITATSNNTSGGAHNHPITMQMQYVDMIICTRN
jgi:hypothetical protein